VRVRTPEDDGEGVGFRSDEAGWEPKKHFG